MVGSSTESLEEKCVLVTGATDGLGRETAFELAASRATVLVHGRDRAKGEEVVTAIQKHTEGLAELYLADLASQTAVREVAAAVSERHDQLDVLVNNAGASFADRGETADGVERTLAINHLAPFLLTHELVPLLEASEPARVVTVSSGVHRRATIDFEDLQCERDYGGLEAYAQSKLANVLFTYELARRFDPASLTATCFSPGFVPETGLYRNADLPVRLTTGAIGRLPNALVRRLPNTIETINQAARTPVYLVSSPEVRYVSGWHFEDQQPALSSPESYDPGVARRLWDVSADLTNPPATIDRTPERQAE